MCQTSLNNMFLKKTRLPPKCQGTGITQFLIKSVLGEIFNQLHLCFLNIFCQPEWMCMQFHSIKRFFIYKLQSSSPKHAFLGWELGARHQGLHFPHGGDEGSRIKGELAASQW